MNGLQQEMRELRTDLSQQMSDLRTELRQRMMACSELGRK